jgi:acyl-CoA thioester hydrolase
LKNNAVKIRVIYADTDAMGVVYHTNYIKWFEIGRNELLREMGTPYAKLESSGYNLPVTEVYCQYFLPARYDDIIFVETKIDYLRRSILKFDYLIWDEKMEKTLTEGYTIHIFTNNDGKIVRAPKTVAEKIV